ncbi:NINE protein [Sediminicola sp. 1XM1-17]|uniref:NINE protein n=1 Tax=Sediminicola sp. 1XM1-17 TaxID=3127702 RepID=UPI003FD1DDC2
MDDSKKKAADLKQETKETAKEFKEGAKETFEEAKKSAKDFKEEAKDTAHEFKEEAKKTAQEFSDGFKSAGGDNKKILAGILAIIFGHLGIHKFILGYQKEGITLLVISIIGYATTCFFFGSFILVATWAIGLIEGIIYLTKSDADFYNTYQVGRKPWF